MAFNLQIQQETYSEVISLRLLAGSVNEPIERLTRGELESLDIGFDPREY